MKRLLLLVPLMVLFLMSGNAVAEQRCCAAVKNNGCAIQGCCEKGTCVCSCGCCANEKCNCAQAKACGNCTCCKK